MIRRGLILTILTGGQIRSSDGKCPVDSITLKVQEKLGLIFEDSIWPPPEGFDRLYFRTKTSSGHTENQTRG